MVKSNVPSSDYCIYLRKSRADQEAEARGEDVLARHRETLLGLASARNLPIAEIYQEVRTGDTITDRPEMQRLLRAVESRLYRGILCMDVDRLGRGDGSDQAQILKTFKYSSTLIITPYKTYDPTSDMDEEFFEYSQYMARGEYKRIKRRMWAGRVAAAKEGKWQSPKAPLGYTRVRLEHERGWTLAINPDTSPAVKMAFDLYADGTTGMRIIANRLNDLGYRTYTGQLFCADSIHSMLSNPVYIGCIRWNLRRTTRAMQDGQEVRTRPLSPECFISAGLHPAIIDKSVYDTVQRRLSGNHAPRISPDHTIKNPYASIMVCSECGHTMVRVPEYQRPIEAYFRCPNMNCHTSRIDCRYVDDAVRDTLAAWLSPSPSESVPSDPVSASQRAALRSRLSSLSAQQDRLRDFVETGVYDVPTFLDRSRALTSRIIAAQEELSALESSPDPVDDAAAIALLRPRIAHILDVWDSSTPQELNSLLRTVIRKIIYHKTHRCFRNENPAAFLSIDIFPVLPPE